MRATCHVHPRWLKRAVSAAFVPRLRHVVVVCVFLLLFTSPRRMDLHSSRARVNAGFLHEDLLAKRALFDGASPTSLVIWPTGPDKWGWRSDSRHGQAVRLGAGRAEVAWPTVRVMTPFEDRSNKSSQLRRVLKEVVYLHRRWAAVPHLAEKSGGGRSVEDGSPCYFERFMAVGRNSAYRQLGIRSHQPLGMRTSCELHRLAAYPMVFRDILGVNGT